VNYRARLRKQVIDLLGGVCVKCGFNDIRAFQVDHINGGGMAHIKSFSSQDKYYKSIIETKGSGLQLLCANCNQIKKIEMHEHRKPQAQEG